LDRDFRRGMLLRPRRRTTDADKVEKANEEIVACDEELRVLSTMGGLWNTPVCWGFMGAGFLLLVERRILEVKAYKATWEAQIPKGN
jgi:hypothetical protein